MISVIIPNYNGEELLRKNLPFVVKAYKNKKNNISEIVIVDDASSDNSINFIKTKYPDIRVIAHKKNRGFSSAVNTGVRSAKGELVCLLNTDVVPEHDFLENIIKHFTNPKIFGVSLHEKGYGPAKGVFKGGFIVHEPIVERQKTTPTFWVNGGSGVFVKKIWKSVGWLDEELFSPFYWEDVDICYRAMKRGFGLLWDYEAKVTHEHEATTSKINKKYRMRIQERNHLFFMWKNITSRQLLRKHITGLTKRIIKNPGYIRVVLMALLKIYTVMKLRKKEKRECKVSDEGILANF